MAPKQSEVFMKFDKAKFIHNSNAIEGVEASVKEAEEAVRSGKSANRHIWNHLKAFEYVDKLEYPLTPLKLKDIHRMLSFKILGKKECGSFRESDVIVGQHTPPNWKKVPTLLKDLIYVINLKKDPWLCHLEFECIHPFIDFNGRTGRMLLYWQEKTQSKEPRIILNEGKQSDYYNKLFEYETRNRPTWWKISAWRKILGRNKTYVCTECGTHHPKVVEKCRTCDNSNEDKFQIYTEAPPFIGPVA